MLKLQEKKLLLYLKHREDQLRQEAQRELELFTQRIKGEMEGRMVSLMNEKVCRGHESPENSQESKTRECREFKQELAEKIAAMQRVLGEMDSKIGRSPLVSPGFDPLSAGLEASYAQCCESLQSDFEAAVEGERGRLEEKIKKELQGVANKERAALFARKGSPIDVPSVPNFLK